MGPGCWRWRPEAGAAETPGPGERSLHPPTHPGGSPKCEPGAPPGSPRPEVPGCALPGVVWAPPPPPRVSGLRSPVSRPGRIGVSAPGDQRARHRHGRHQRWASGAPGRRAGVPLAAGMWGPARRARRGIHEGPQHGLSGLGARPRAPRLGLGSARHDSAPPGPGDGGWSGGAPCGLVIGVLQRLAPSDTFSSFYLLIYLCSYLFAGVGTGKVLGQVFGEGWKETGVASHPGTPYLGALGVAWGNGLVLGDLIPTPQTAFSSGGRRPSPPHPPDPTTTTTHTPQKQPAAPLLLPSALLAR